MQAKKANRSKCYNCSLLPSLIAVIENKISAEIECLASATGDDSKADRAVKLVQKCALVWHFRSDYFHHAKRI